MINSVIDISHWQTIQDAQAIKSAGIIAIIHKATESGSYVDPMFFKRREWLKEQGFLFGSYHFLRRNGAKEAQFYIDKVKPDDKEVIMLDTESQQLSNEDNIAESEAFVKKVRDLTGRYPVWYIGNFLLNSQSDYDGSILTNCPLFIARYSSKQPNVPKGFGTWTLWQYTQDGVVPGITTVDRDYFNGDLEGLLKLWNAGEQAQAFEGINIQVTELPDNA